MKIMSINYFGANGDTDSVSVSTDTVNKAESIYSNDFKLGVIISTHASTPYIHLGLESWRRNYPSVKVLVHDDCSDESSQLRILCHRYGADFESNNIQRGHTVGDLTAFYGGLMWAKRKEIDVLVKFSRRFIPLYDWTPEFRDLANESQAHTFSNICTNLNWGFRTECVAMHVPTWENSLSKIAAESDKSNVFCEGFIHNIAKELPVCERYSTYLNKNRKPDWCAGHVDWKLLGNNRVKKVDGLLWHHSCHPSEYTEQSKAYELPYVLKDFVIQDSHLSQDTRPRI